MIENRKILKQNARRHLSGKFGTALLVAALFMLIENAFSLMTRAGFHWVPEYRLYFQFSDFAFPGRDGVAASQLIKTLSDFVQNILADPGRFLLYAVIHEMLGLIFVLLVVNVLLCGRSRWFLRADHPQLRPSTGMMFSVFSRGQYWKTMAGMLWHDFWLFIWSIPLRLASFFALLPGGLITWHVLRSGVPFTEGMFLRIAKEYGLPVLFFRWPWMAGMGVLFLASAVVLLNRSYRYRLTPYVLADNPSVGVRRALDISKKMTEGQVWRMILLDLSFTGWLMLCALIVIAPWIGILFLMPYYLATWAEAYRALRDEVVRKGGLTMEELGYVRVVPPQGTPYPPFGP